MCSCPHNDSSAFFPPLTPSVCLLPPPLCFPCARYQKGWVLCTADAYRAVIVLSQSFRVLRTVSLLSSANTIRGLNIPPTVPGMHCTQRIKYFLPKSSVGILWLATDATAWPAVLIDYLAQKLLAFAPASSGYAHPAGSPWRWILHRADEFASICNPSVADLRHNIVLSPQGLASPRNPWRLTFCRNF